MTRLAVVVEGPTETEFIDKVLGPHLIGRGLRLFPISLDGDVRVPRLGGFMGRSLENNHFVTSLVDFYGFRDKQSGESPRALEDRIDREVSKYAGYAPCRVIPYVQQYEFEALLFSDVSAFSILPFASDRSVQELREIRSQYPNPEDINDNPDTAPGKRIERVVRRYNKPGDGYVVAEEIGLEKIRAECPRFNEWVTCLEALGNPSALP